MLDAGERGRRAAHDGVHLPLRPGDAVHGPPRRARATSAQPYHFRAQRFQDWGDRNLGWRQVKKLAGTGELGDMLAHRIDYGHFLVGADRPPRRRHAAVHRRPRAAHAVRPRRLGRDPRRIQRTGATGVLESTKLATGRGEGGTAGTTAR